MKIYDNSNRINKAIFNKFLISNEINIEEFSENVFDKECIEENCCCPLIEYNIPSDLNRICFKKLEQYLNSINKKDFIDDYLDFISSITQTKDDFEE
ncbi:hypothetical protein [Brachyspira hampsonii]|uniref:Uncharacterized protein n=1 Tax=Brachyspira hampsonii TaxID=1287055 RepID=A0AAC9XJU1_9SPIR|nr:hypothetical protein [Brachyspira hampsonii]ASJ20985.1 hypothetical protein BHAMNSH16_04735 [Brachyspira hampsonii]ELV06657.1 hypothetical protein H263_02809 [Brachyspira hampsonii 30599]MBW5380233.1 hypothetical protein [Brachyspira hampsonii]OEJ13286.1 hypothetical protein A9496_02435 [Brachyspira hampsonii]